MTTVLFWDIDGTLLTTARAGIFALEDAAQEVIGRPVDLSEMETAGLTDAAIAAKILELYGVEPEPEQIYRLLDLYGQYLPGSLPRRQGQVLHGVREILECLHDRSDVVSFLLTGNIPAGAKAKLTHYGLNHFFTQTTFPDCVPDRAKLAKHALAIAEDILGQLHPERVYVIGDTPHDIHCGKAIGARVVAVASGSYSVAQLAAYEPWWTIEQLPSPDIFLEKLGLEKSGLPQVE